MDLRLPGVQRMAGKQRESGRAVRISPHHQRQLSDSSLHIFNLLKKHLSTFSQATCTNVGLAALDGAALFPQRTQFPRFCQLVGADPAGAHACRQAAVESVKYALDYGSPYIYRCHAGLIEWCIPIVVDGICLGMVVGGQVAMWDMDDVAVQEILEGLRPLGIRSEQLEGMIREIPVMTSSRVQAVATTLSLAISHLVSSDHWRDILAGIDPPGATAAEVVSYIKSHYWKQLSVEGIASAFYVSPSYLSRLFRRETGYSIVSYLTRVRLEKAKELLAGSDLTAWQIADRVGFSDQSYFSRVFKMHEGVSPAQYRRRQQPTESGSSPPVN